MPGDSDSDESGSLSSDDSGFEESTEEAKPTVRTLTVLTQSDKGKRARKTSNLNSKEDMQGRHAGPAMT